MFIQVVLSSTFFCLFLVVCTARRYASAVYAVVVCLSVRLPVCLTNYSLMGVVRNKPF